MSFPFRVLTITVCVGMLAGALLPGKVSGAPSGWDMVGPGVEYQMMALPGPNVAYVARMDRSNQQMTIESVVANNQIYGGGEYVSSMAARMEGSVSQWEPGSGQTNQVVVAINGSGYTGGNATPKSGMINSGWYAKRFYDNAGHGAGGFGWRRDRAAFIGRCVYNDPKQAFVRFEESGHTVQINAVNAAREPNQLVMYSPQWGATTRTSPDGVELLVELMEPMTLKANPGVRAMIRAVRDGAGSTHIPFDGLVLSAVGTARDELLKGAEENAVIEINQRLNHTDWDCVTDNTFSWAGTYASMQGDYEILREGEVFPKSEDPGATLRQPRTAIAYNDQYIFFIVVDGRNPGYSVGMSFEELAYFARDTLGATSAMAQDGGGSSVMVINGRVVNYPVSKCPAGATNAPQDSFNQAEPGSPRAYLPLVSKFITSEDGNLYACERAVANSMMMVSLQPAKRSASFQDFDQVNAAASVDVRTGPGINYPKIATIPAGTTGTVIPHFGGLNGVFAKGSYWWKVDANGTVGWVSEPFLGYGSTPPNGLSVDFDYLDIEMP